MRHLSIILSLFILTNFSYGQTPSNLKKIVINKKNTLPSDWVSTLQEHSGQWVFQKEVYIKSKKANDHYWGEKENTWTFEESTVNVSPYHWKMNGVKYLDFDIIYHQRSRAIVLSTEVTNAGKTFDKNIVYKIINLTDEYLVLEEIKNTFCFDFSTGRLLTKKECKEKQKNQPKRMFGGKSITIGKPHKSRLVFKRK